MAARKTAATMPKAIHTFSLPYCLGGHTPRLTTGTLRRRLGGRPNGGGGGALGLLGVHPAGGEARQADGPHEVGKLDVLDGVEILLDLLVRLDPAERYKVREGRGSKAAWPTLLNKPATHVNISGWLVGTFSSGAYWKNDHQCQVGMPPALLTRPMRRKKTKTTHGKAP